MSWREFWNGEHKMYVNARHSLVHFEEIANRAAFYISSSDARVLDYGCGEALAANVIASRCGHLYLYDSAPKIENALRKRYRASDKISVLSERELEALPDATLDLFICNSIFQYLSREECREVAAFAAQKLKLGGKMLVGDIVPPNVDKVADSLALLDFAYRGGFFLAALRGMMAKFLSLDPRMRPRLGLTTFSIPDMQRLLSIEGFETRRIDRNIGHNRTHMSFVGKRI
ncbi:MAG TPA: class I SAM-dependent methyltransferase [Methylovirgula sp.]